MSAAPLPPSDRLKLLEGKKAFSSEAAAAGRLFCTFLSISRSFVRSPSNLSNARKNTKMPSLHSTLFGFKVKPKPRCVKTARNVAFAFTLKSNTVNSVFVVQLYYSYNRKKGHFMRLEIKRK